MGVSSSVSKDCNNRTYIVCAEEGLEITEARVVRVRGGPCADNVAPRIRLRWPIPLEYVILHISEKLLSFVDIIDVNGGR